MFGNWPCQAVMHLQLDPANNRWPCVAPATATATVSARRGLLLWSDVVMCWHLLPGTLSVGLVTGVLGAGTTGIHLSFSIRSDNTRCPD
jgi:hypothetical protein